MSVSETLKVIKEIGISTAAFGLCAYLTIFIVKRLAHSIDELVKRMDVFMTRVREEHERSTKEHGAIMNQHERIIEKLSAMKGSQ